MQTSVLDVRDRQRQGSSDLTGVIKKNKQNEQVVEALVKMSILHKEKEDAEVLDAAIAAQLVRRDYHDIKSHKEHGEYHQETEETSNLHM